MNTFKCKPWGLSLQDCLGWYFRKGQLAFTLCRLGAVLCRNIPHSIISFTSTKD
ncbi:hypothetical protein GIB67_004943 [Kingdonia uniflora]|uniref:Uncharacterized protein n=1 Tax=Kingdonia uniflora TaxID=39325 RepID=A0A7J7P8G4_9MAGN|nr:hypothetical protein GIB67_004943 [Kingdonia uniflora]